MPNLNRDENTQFKLEVLWHIRRIVENTNSNFQNPVFFSTLIIYFHVDWYAITLFMIWH